MSFPQGSPSRFPSCPSPLGEGARKRKLLDRVRDVCRLRHYSIHTEQAYVHWIRKYILYFNKRHPRSCQLFCVKVLRGCRVQYWFIR
jgi:hypothetical protein